MRSRRLTLSRWASTADRRAMLACVVNRQHSRVHTQNDLPSGTTLACTLQTTNLGRQEGAEGARGKETQCQFIYYSYI